MPVPIEPQDDPFRQSDSLVYALAYQEKGWNPTLISNGSKAARLKDWETRRLSRSEIEAEFRPDDNIGLVLGETSGNLVLVDLDSVTAIQASDRFLPGTGLVAGRAKKPNSHRFYCCEPLPKNKQFLSPKLGKVHVEILSNGKQAAVPPSRLSDGERKSWFRFDEPATVGADDLTEQVTRLAVHCELAAIWPDAGRHNAALALAGGLLRADWSEEEVQAEIEVLCQDTVNNRREIPNLVRDTATKLANEVPGVTGWPTLAKLTGEKASIDAILTWLGVTGVDVNDDRPAVRVTAGNLDKTSRQAWEALALTNDPPVLFRRSNRPFRVERIDDSDIVVMRELDDTLLRHHLVEAIRWYRIVDGQPTPTKPPLDLVKNLRAYADIPLPVLNRVVTVPVFSPSGTLQTEPGYHPEARVYFEPPEGLDIPRVVEEPTDANVERARSLLLDDLLGEFPFAGEADKAHAVALAVLPFVRDLVDGPTPLHMFEASKAGTGKGLLVRVLTTIFAGGTGSNETPLSTVEEELRKKILSLLMEGHPFIHFDNINEKIDSASLAGALTSMTFQDRKLGVSETAYIPVRCVWLATANNPAMTTEIARRTVRCRLVAEVEHPHLRTGFRHPDLFDHLRRNRGEFIWATLTLVQAWIAKGRPKGTKTLGTYEAWATTVGGILDAAGIRGFLGNLDNFYAEADSEGTAWRQFVAAWWDVHGPATVTASKLLPLATEAGLSFTSTWEDKQKGELGQMLRKQIDSIYAGFAIRAGKPPRGSDRAYKLEAREGQVWTPGASEAASGPFELVG